MENHIYREVQTLLNSSEKLKNLEAHGYCQWWAGEALQLIKAHIRDLQLPLVVEAREVSFNNSFSHTFIRLIAENQPAFLIDKLGVEHFPPFEGYEEEAPSHLLASKYDPLNYYF